MRRGCFRGHGAENKNVWGHCAICTRDRYNRTPAVRQREIANVKRRRAKNTAEFIIGALRSNAKKRGQEFAISAKDILPLPTHCPVLGMKLDYSGSGKKDRSDWPSVDRLNSTVGYLPGNVAVISYRANRMKCNATTEEVRMLLAWMEKN